MLRAERFLVLGSLALSSLAVVLALRGAAGNPAYAATAFRLGDLGPADALLLTTGEGKEDMRVAAKDGRLAWGEHATDRAWSMAAVDIDRIMKKLLDGTSYTEKRDELRERIEKTEQDFQSRAEDIQKRFPIGADGVPPEEGRQAFEVLEQEYRAFRQGAIAESDKLTADQFESAYRELVAAVEAVSEKESIDLVYRFQPTSDPFEAKAPAESVDRIRARTFLKYPEAFDITEEVMKALNLS
ncbi:MAG: hypothetical protein RL136_2260 [Planctomycetota bacterium]|jgi:Skp family chaperone for outer membrane proteins